MPDDSDREPCLFQEEMRFALDAGYRLVAQSLVTGIEARELRLETDGDPASHAAADACLGAARAGR